MDKQLRIRPYQITDLEDILTIFDSNVPQYFAASERADLIRYLQEEIADYFVVLQQDQLIGAGGINYDADGTTARLSWDFIDRDFHKSGAGTFLTHYRIQHALAKENIDTLMVRTSQLAEAFYVKQGFHVLERITDYWAPGFDMVNMRYQP